MMAGLDGRAGAAIELPQGMEEEERMLSELARIPGITKAWCLPQEDGSVELRVRWDLLPQSIVPWISFVIGKTPLSPK